MKPRLLATIYLTFLVSASAEATLIDRGGGLIYDTALNVTWLQDANIGGNITSPSSALYWAENYRYHDPIRNIDWDDWRLPKDNFSCFGPENCTNSELGHLFYLDGVTYSTPDPFFNLQGGYYWFGTPTGVLGNRSFEFITGGTALDVSCFGDRLCLGTS